MSGVSIPSPCPRHEPKNIDPNIRWTFTCAVGTLESRSLKINPAGLFENRLLQNVMFDQVDHDSPYLNDYFGVSHRPDPLALGESISQLLKAAT